MNGPDVNHRLTSKSGRIAELIAARACDAKIVQELYLAAFSRFPSPAESKIACAGLRKATSREQAAQDLLWVLLNSKEFLFNH
jgi:hypothetical protein